MKIAFTRLSHLHVNMRMKVVEEVDAIGDHMHVIWPALVHRHASLVKRCRQRLWFGKIFGAATARSPRACHRWRLLIAPFVKV